MERNGWLRVTSEPSAGPRSPRLYRLTPRGHDVLKVARAMVGELHGEVVGKKREASVRGRIDLARSGPGARRKNRKR
jgi:DNA-binding PadR family transcriptional regulator